MYFNRSGHVLAGERTMSCAMTSESVVELNSQPYSSSSLRNGAAFTTLPLWANAICPAMPETLMGCALQRALEPLVE